MNSGDWNSCNGSNGVFCTKEPTICIFNIQTNWTLTEFRNSKYFEALYQADFLLTYIEDDKLKTRTYKEACAIWWENTTDKNKETIKSIPNFNSKIFEEITGIKV